MSADEFAWPGHIGESSRVLLFWQISLHVVVYQVCSLSSPIRSRLALNLSCNVMCHVHEWVMINYQRS